MVVRGLVMICLCAEPNGSQKNVYYLRALTKRTSFIVGLVQRVNQE